MKEAEARRKALALVERSGIALVGSNSGDGHPWIKAMLKMEADELKTVWFSTNTSSRRVSQFRDDPRACVYFVDFSDWMGLMLLGKIELMSDIESRKRLWRDGFERYYPLGLEDPDYTVLRFGAESANYYHQIDNLSFAP
ncbi:MAG: pyridoxamine 5'-phosphate oxidase family protein [Gaiellaceae bacterium]